ncbi:hypothetical protein [Thalassotalea piscium]|uniref:Uncharacterized protein n=1 Tax=Thalassotalea piscium TaxID=1230533 RepID=A0A7X0NFW1_9GAMM|nr:hypothetical protein [Thalassotalea piscium]MBB6542630.1 hypothetical protein [Thalassotalea piscium]
MKFYKLLLIAFTTFSIQAFADTDGSIDVSTIMTKEEFLTYKDVGEFIDHSPKVTIEVKPEVSDINQYGAGVIKTLTGSDCNRDGVMDDNKTCNAVYYRLWLKYQR